MNLKTESLVFCKLDIVEKQGKIDCLVVLKEYRSKGYGEMLMEWAFGLFRQYGVNQIEVKVADGNSAVGFYEKYGFRMNAHILKTDL